jgi:hypothetical protein
MQCTSSKKIPGFGGKYGEDMFIRNVGSSYWRGTAPYSRDNILHPKQFLEN